MVKESVQAGSLPIFLPAGTMTWKSFSQFAKSELDFLMNNLLLLPKK